MVFVYSAPIGIRGLLWFGGKPVVVAKGGIEWDRDLPGFISTLSSCMRSRVWTTMRDTNDIVPAKWGGPSNRVCTETHVEDDRVVNAGPSDAPVALFL